MFRACAPRARLVRQLVLDALGEVRRPARRDGAVDVFVVGVGPDLLDKVEDVAGPAPAGEEGGAARLSRAAAGGAWRRAGRWARRSGQRFQGCVLTRQEFL